MSAPTKTTTLGARGLWLALLLSSAILFSPEAPEKPTWVSDAKQAAFEPTACMDSSGHLWALWISTGRAKETTARIAGTVRLGSEAVADFTIEDAGLFPAAPHVAAWKSGAYLVWEAGGDGARQLFGRELTLADSRDSVILGELETLPSGTTRPLVPRLAARKDSLALVYQGLRGSNYELFFATRDASGWSESRALTETDTDEWNPRVAVDGADGLHLVWDFFEGESFEVAYARIEEGKLKDQRLVASGAPFQGYPELAVDTAGVAWIAWEAGPQFGKHGGLRSARNLGLAKLSRSDAPENSGALSLERLAPVSLTADVSQRGFARPTLTTNGLLLTYNFPLRANRKRGHLFTSWMTSVVEFTGGQAVERRVPMTDGNSDPDSVLVADPAGGAWLVFSSDRRREQFDQVTAWSDSIERRPHVAILRVNTDGGFPQLLESTPLPETEPRESLVRAAKPTANVYFGDLHRHTHLSRCAGAKDGTILDAYRYARGPGALDFIAITDHFQHMKPWSWFCSKRDAIRYHAPGSLVVLSGVERVRAKRGHYNDIYFDPAEVPFDVDTWMRPPARFAPAPPEHVISIPHMMAVDDGTGFNWDEFAEERTRLFEIYQGKRGSYEGRGLPYEADDRVEEEVALARGFERGAHFGLIAASDHASSSTSFAGLYAEELTRESVFNALQNRRCFAATVARPLDASLGKSRDGIERRTDRRADLSGQRAQEPRRERRLRRVSPRWFHARALGRLR